MTSSRDEVSASDTIGVVRAEGPEPWSWRSTEGGPVDFVVWALRDDGLTVPPFDAHPGGNGLLRAAGIETSAWRAWLGAVVARHVRLERMRRDDHRLRPEDINRLREAAEQPSAAAREARRSELREELERQVWIRRNLSRGLDDPIAGWPGDATVKVALVEAHARYQAFRRSLPAPSDDVIEQRWARRAAAEQGLYDEFSGRRARPASLDIHEVAYPVPVVDAVPPVSLVLGVPVDVDEGLRVELLRTGFRRLAV